MPSPSFPPYAQHWREIQARKRRARLAPVISYVVGLVLFSLMGAGLACAFYFAG